MSLPRVCALTCVRNEIAFLPGLIDHCVAQGVDLIVIDNGSDDGSRECVEARVGDGVLRLEDLPFEGSFSMSAQLQRKQELIAALPHDWILNMDADEIIEPATPGMTLPELAAEAGQAGCNAVNFDEFVFLPEAGQDVSEGGAYRGLTRYYFFAPGPHRLMRFWRRDAELDNRTHAGHKLSGEVKLYPQSQILRHYIALSQAHVNNKYVGRVFDSRELERGWHGNRLGLTEEDLSLAAVPDEALEHLSSPESRDFSRARPHKTHYWHWTGTGAGAEHVIRG